VDGSRSGGPSEVVTVSESPGHAWEPPEESGDTFELGSDSDAESEEETAPTDDLDATDERYTAGPLGDYVVSATTKDRYLTANLGSVALRKLYVQPGDRLEVYEHPRGLLVVPSYETHEEKPESDVAGDDRDHEEFNLDWAWQSDDEEPAPEQWAAEESGPIPPEVPWSEMVAYQCRCYYCGRGCINHVEESCTQAKECRSCHWIPVLGDLDPLTDHLPDDADLETDPEVVPIEGGDES